MEKHDESEFALSLRRQERRSYLRRRWTASLVCPILVIAVVAGAMSDREFLLIIAAGGLITVALIFLDANSHLREIKLRSTRMMATKLSLLDSANPADGKIAN